MNGSSLQICILSDGLPYHHGGAQLRAYRHAERLNAMEDTQAILIAWDRTNDPLATDNLPAYVYPVRLGIEPGSQSNHFTGILLRICQMAEISFKLGRLLFKLRNQFDLIHIINAASMFSLISVPLAKALGKPTIIEMVSLGADDPLTLNKRSKQPKKQLFPHRPIKYSLFLGADAFVSKSDALSAACRQANLPPEKLIQIYSAVDEARFKPASAEEKRDLRQSLGLSPEKTILIFVGGLREEKGVQELIEAYSQLSPANSHLHLVIIGPRSYSSPRYPDKVLEWIWEKGLYKQITFIDEVIDNVDEYMRAADIFVHPSQREGLSMVILEAMSCGLAVVASNIPAIADSQIKNNRNGMLVPPLDAGSLASALLELIEDKIKRVKIGKAARQDILNKFSLPSIDSQYLSLYRMQIRLNYLKNRNHKPNMPIKRIINKYKKADRKFRQWVQKSLRIRGYSGYWIWKLGLKEAIDFWEYWLRTEGGDGFPNYSFRTDPQAPLEDFLIELLDFPIGSEVQILDVGAGPMTSLGKIWDGRKVTITAVDPMAVQYEKLLKKYRVKPPVPTTYGIAEDLLSTFSPNTFDLTHAQNCLDHAYNPLLAIQQMLAVTKPNHFVYLNHITRVAEREDFYGLHQWNFYDRAGHLYVANPQCIIDVTEELEGQADVSIIHHHEVWIAAKLKKLNASDR